MMKKLFNFALFGAIALTGTFGFTACSSSEETATADVNPTFDPATNSVTTQFVLNVSSATNSNLTRQSATTVQKNSNFRGMQDAILVGLATGKASTFLAPYDGSATTTNWEATSGVKSKVYDLGTLYGQNAISNSGTNNADNSSHRVVELTLPLTTDAMLVYGRAIAGNDDEENGKVIYNVAPSGVPENTTFDLVSRLGDNATKYTQTCNLAALVLNRIMLSQINALAYNSENPYKTAISGTDGYKQTEDLPALSWRGLGAATTTLSPLQENLATLYRAVTGLTTSTTAIRSGSNASLTDMLKDIYTIVNTVYHATPTNDAELNAQRLAYEIITRMGYYFNTTEGNFRTVGPVTTEGTISYNLVHQNILTEAQYNTNYGNVTNLLFATFPSSFSLPEGVSQLYFTDYDTSGNNGFSYTSPSQSLIDVSTTLNPAKYMYPSELLYFDNSLLRVNTADIAASAYPNGYNVWDTETSWTTTSTTTWPTAWTVGAVTSSTRSVAVKNNINYGVAMLETKVALKSGVSAFEDNRHVIVPTESNQTLSAAEVSNFTLTGVLIGGQYKKLGWNYLAKAGATSNDNYVIYDNKIANSGAIPTTEGNSNYTLVFDNYKSSGDQDYVMVALEFQNGDEKDFYGKGGVVTKGSKFYLVGKLDLTATTTTGTITWPTYYAIPPYTTAGVTTDIKRVFIQDYLTTATFTITETSLQNAYNTVPDLRATQTSLGLSVDLNWRPGLSFAVDL